MQRALEARLSEARRKMAGLQAGADVPHAVSAAAAVDSSVASGATSDDPRAQQIEAELAALKREIGNDS